MQTEDKNNDKQDVEKTKLKWKKSEHERFLEGLKHHKKNWKKISKVVKTKDAYQVKAHAKKHFALEREQPNGEKKITPEVFASCYLISKSKRKNYDYMLPMVSSLTNQLLSAQYNQLGGDLLVAELDQTVRALTSVPDDLDILDENLNDALYEEGQEEEATIAPDAINDNTNVPNYDRILAFLGTLFNPDRYDPTEVFSELNSCDKTTLKILLHNLSMTLSVQCFQEEYNHVANKIKEDDAQQIGGNVTQPTQLITTSQNILPLHAPFNFTLPGFTVPNSSSKNFVINK
ncbi:Myb-like protein [Acrasis kona]|uniref:Myb-like protein n=1 Tax=Acrasis kona TaxID=1008807 RepID=A0AAW2Z4V5_9EUKA